MVGNQLGNKAVSGQARRLVYFYSDTSHRPTVRIHRIIIKQMWHDELLTYPKPCCHENNSLLVNFSIFLTWADRYLDNVVFKVIFQDVNCAQGTVFLSTHERIFLIKCRNFWGRNVSGCVLNMMIIIWIKLWSTAAIEIASKTDSYFILSFYFICNIWHECGNIAVFVN